MNDEITTHDSQRIDDAVAFRLHRTNRMLITHLARFLTMNLPAITPEKWFILARLSQDGPLRQVDLTEEGLSDAPNVSRLVDGLVVSGYVERVRDADDRRSNTLQLTQDGELAAKTLMAEAVHERHLVFAGFSEDELHSLTSTLDRIDANVRGLLLA
jgi:DNA-binding MarR family transcriptional regulator